MTNAGNRISNWIGGRAVDAEGGATFEKRSPHDGRVLSIVPRSTAADVDAAARAARAAQPGWAATPPVQRGHLLHQLCNALERRAADIAAVVARETGKSPGEAAGETGGGIACGRFFAGEGQRLFGRTTTSGQAHKYAMTVRMPRGVAALIVPANTPIANVCWKVFPALVCGNSVVLKTAEDSPETAHLFADIAHEAGLPAGVLNVVHGFADGAGKPLVEHPDVDLVSFTGSTGAGKWIGETCGRMLRRVSLELGGKNPLIVCDDADLDKAVKWTCLSGFSNAGQRCAAGSRIIVLDAVYDIFRGKLLEAVSKLKVGPDNGDDFGPVISDRQLGTMLAAVETAKTAGARVLCGGERLIGERHAQGFYMSPTVIEDDDPASEISARELFGPIVCLYRVKDYATAFRVANASPFGLTACIHTKNVHRAIDFAQTVRAGVAVVNAGTYGSEPHMPFGGFGLSGNGSREPGTEALDVYSELKDIYIVVEPDQIGG